MIKEMKNYEIMDAATKMNAAFAENNSSQLLPMRMSFFIQRNRKTLNDIVENINTCKNQIIQKFGTPSPEDSKMYTFEGDAEEKANKEFSDLMNIKIDVDLHLIKFSDIDDSIQISNEQMDAILFMIEE